MAAVKFDIMKIFAEAIRYESATGRAEFLDAACQGDIQVRCRVDALLQAHVDSGKCLGGPSTAASSIQPGEDQIGPYTLREQIGEGGMGIVYVAEQSEPVRRKVALKITKPGMATKSVVARFEAERQALAMMDHPNVATVHDGGATEDGRPYFVMELVQGAPITEYCDQQRLDIRQRLQLFRQVCEAVEHAHRKGIIHQDLKPSNVLVPEIDGRAQPKVIDFGIAKALGEKLSDATAYTHCSQIVGTPAYMSPEQAGMGVVDVDTRSDVYSLGVLLYELLTGNTPFDSEILQQAGYDEMRRMIREVEPACPSKMLSTLDAETLSTVSQARSVDPRQLRISLCGELDWLVTKALEKDRDRRYESASVLAEDVERFLSNHPIFARPPSAAYRIKKYVQRNKAHLVPAALAVAALLVGMTFAVSAVLKERVDKQTAWDELESLQADTARRLYASQMVQAVKAWEDRDYGALEEFLQSTTPQTSQPQDFRDWEWHYLHEQLRRPFATTPSRRVYEVAWHPHENDIAVVVEKSTNDSAIEVWKPGNPLPLRTVAEIPGTPASAVVGFDWSANGNRIAFITRQGRAIVLDAATGGTLFDQQVHEGESFGVSLSPAADILATASWFGQIKIWDINTEQLVEVLFDPDSAKNLRCIASSPEGAHLAATLRSGQRVVWSNLKPENRIDYERVDTGTFGMLEWSANGKCFAAADGHQVSVYQVGIVKPIAVFPHREVSHVCWIDDNSIASCGADHTIQIWGLHEEQIIRSLRLDRAPLTHLDVSSDGQFLATGGLPGLNVIRLASELGYDVLLPPEGNARTGSDVSWSGDGHRIAVKHSAGPGRNAAEHKKWLRIYDLRTSRLLTSLYGGEDIIGHGHIPMLCWSADDTRILDVDYQGRRFEYGVHDPMSRVVNDELQHLFGEFHHLALNQDLGLLAVAGDSEVWICNPDHIQTVDHRIPIKGNIWSVRLSWSPDNRSLLIAYVIDGNIHIKVHHLQRQQTTELPRIIERDDPVVAWNPTSTRMAIGVREAMVYIRSLIASEEATTLVGHNAPIRDLSWSPSGTRIASCANDGTVRIWDASRGDQLAVFHLPGESQLLDSVQWSPDGRRLAAGGSRGEVFILDAGSSVSRTSKAKHAATGLHAK